MDRDCVDKVCLSNNDAISCGQYSKTRNIDVGFLPTAILCNATRFGCWRAFNNLISRIDVNGNCEATGV